MCGRYALALEGDELELEIAAMGASVQSWIDRDVHRPSYNVAPQNRAPVLRRTQEGDQGLVLHTMKWGLVPHWTKRAPDYGSMLKTINARDDSVLGKGGMWASMKGRKRCAVPCQGFYEWLKKGNDKIPHFTKPLDGKIMCLAGLWDSVTYEGEETPLYSYTIITTSSNDQLSFLHDRMPVILSTKEELETWLDTSSGEFTDSVARLLKPYDGKLDCYVVPKEVGKVGNQSPDFIKPVAERRGNIASFFAIQAGSPKKSPAPVSSSPSKRTKPEPETEPPAHRPHLSAKGEPMKSEAELRDVGGKDDGVAIKHEEDLRSSGSNDQVVELNPDEKAESLRGPTSPPEKVQRRLAADAKPEAATRSVKRAKTGDGSGPGGGPSPKRGGKGKKAKSPAGKGQEKGQRTLSGFIVS